MFHVGPIVGRIAADQLRKVILENFDMSLGAGLGKLAGRVFRIGHLGSFNDLMLAGTLSGVEMGLRLAGVPHKDGGVMAALDCLGTIVTAPGKDCDFVSRFFAPQAGIPEDPVTGSSHCTLIPYWAGRLGKQELFAKQLVERPVEFAANQLVLAVTPHAHIAALADLERPGVTIALGTPRVPVGEYTATALSRLPATQRGLLEGNIRDREPSEELVTARDSPASG